MKDDLPLNNANTKTLTKTIDKFEKKKSYFKIILGGM